LTVDNEKQATALQRRVPVYNVGIPPTPVVGASVRRVTVAWSVSVIAQRLLQSWLWDSEVVTEIFNYDPGETS